MYLFNHPHESYYDSIQDLYYQYYDFLEFRGNIFDLIDDNIKYSNIFEPEVLETFQPDLKILRNEEMLNVRGKPIEEVEAKLENLNNMRFEIYKVLDKYKRNSLQNTQFVPNLMGYYIILDYIEYRLDKIKEKKQIWVKEHEKKDPFITLKETNSLTNEELEIVIYLYYIRFDGPTSIHGSLLLKKIFGMQSEIFSAQKYLLPDSVLIKNNIVSVINEGYDWMDSDYSISKNANLFISSIK